MNKPTVVISKCIEHESCRYDGSHIASSFVKQISDYVDFVTVCPEVAIGLPIPRQAIRVVRDAEKDRLVFSMSGEDVTDDMNEFTDNYLSELRQTRVHGFILKNRSPSCGIKDVKIYKSTGKSQAIHEKTSGFFGRGVLDNFKGYAIEDEGRLLNKTIREHFLTRIYTMSSFDEVFDTNTMKSLVKFHTNNKYLLMSFNQVNQVVLGRIVANSDNLQVSEVINKYYQLLQETLENPRKKGPNMNMLMHLMGYFKNDLSKGEKAYFLDVLEQYNNNKVIFSVPIAVIYSWVIRFDQDYLKNQTIFNPFPLEILNLSDSGK